MFDKSRFLLGLALMFCLTFFSFAQEDSIDFSANGKKVLYIDSYHPTYDWSIGVLQGVKDGLNKSGVTLETFYMDAKNHPEEADKQAAALQAKQKIESFKPDIVITCDDDAVKYILVQYFKDSSLPFVFCGVNWSADEYGLPFKNATGILEVDFFKTIVLFLDKVAKGKRLGFISFDGISERRNEEKLREIAQINFDKVYFEKTFDSWKANFLKLQNEVDILFITNPKGIEGWDDQKAQEFVYANTKIPTAATHLWIGRKFSVLAITKIPQEQGQWTAKTALAILAGKAIHDIPIAKNRQTKIIINKTLMEKLNIRFSPDLMGKAEIVQ